MTKREEVPVFQQPHPRQPVVVAEDGVHRFKANAIVRYMLDEGSRAGLFSLNTFALGRRDDNGAFTEFSREDHEQLAQLTGYSVSGACDLSYMSDTVCDAALAESERLAAKPQAPASRAELAARAQRLATYGASSAPPGTRIVVIVTDETGEFVGVGSTTGEEDVRAILTCALLAEDRVDHTDEPGPP